MQIAIDGISEESEGGVVDLSAQYCAVQVQEFVDNVMITLRTERGELTVTVLVGGYTTVFHDFDRLLVGKNEPAESLATKAGS